MKIPKHPIHLHRPNIPKTLKASRPGYEYLTCYQLGLVLQELTEKFCKLFLTPNHPNTPNPNFRQIQQMEQAARSIPANIAEGYTQKSLKGYIYLSGIARGSNEELGKDYFAYLKKNKLEIWHKTHPKIRELRAFRVKWISPTSLNTPTLPQNPQEAANMLLTFCQMEGYLLKKLVDSLKEKHKTEGGLTPHNLTSRLFVLFVNGSRSDLAGQAEKLYHARKSYRGY